MLPQPGLHVAHQPHQPGEGDGDEDQHVLRDHRHLAPTHLAGSRRVAEEEHVDGGDRHHREQHREHLRHREPDPHRGLDEVAVHTEEDDDGGRRREDRELRRMALLRPRHRRHLAGPAVEQEADERRQDQDVDGGVLGRHHAEEPEDGVRGSAHRPDLRDRGDDRTRRRPDHEAEHDHRQEVLDHLLEALRAFDPPHPQPEVVIGGEEQVADEHRLDDEEPREGAAHHRQAERLRVGGTFSFASQYPANGSGRKALIATKLPM